MKIIKNGWVSLNVQGIFHSQTMKKIIKFNDIFTQTDGHLTFALSTTLVIFVFH